MTHTTPIGSQSVVEMIAEGLDAVFNQTGGGLTRSRPPLFSNNYQHTQIIPVSEQMLKERTRYESGRSVYQCAYLQIESDNQIKFRVELGELVGILFVVGSQSGVIQISTRFRKHGYVLWDQWCYNDRLQSLIFNKHFAAGTKIQVRLTEKPVDYSQCLNPIENPHQIKKNLKVIGFLARQ